MTNIFNISASLSFLDSLSKGILERFGDIQDITILLPTKRSITPLAESFFRAGGDKPMLLPNIQALGDVDAEEFMLRGVADLTKISEPISKTKRIFEIANLIQTKNDGLNIVQATQQAKGLIRLIDEAQNKKIDLKKLADVVPDEFAEHWQLTLNFLEVIIEDWQKLKTERGYLEPNERRNLLLEAASKHWQEHPPKHPVIIAGTTATITATQELIKALINSENGYLVLDGLDRNLSDDDFKKLQEIHPQFGLAEMLRGLEITSSKIIEWEEVQATPRQSLISTAMLPSSRVDEWQDFEKSAEATRGLNFISCESSEEEASVISLIMRQVLEDKNKTAMLVTENRKLAKRVQAKMKIWNVDINDSSGQDITKLTSANFLLQLAEMCASAQAPVKLLSFFKHPYIAADIKQQIREVEIKEIRGLRPEDFKIQNRGIDFDGFTEFEDLFERQSVLLKQMVESHLALAKNVASEERLWSGKGIEVFEFFEELNNSIDEGAEIDPLLYAELLKELMRTKNWWPDYGLHPRLNILSLPEARLVKADVVIMGGMNEGSFPGLPEADSFLNQKIRKEVGLDLLEKRIGQQAHDFELLSLGAEVFYTRATREEGQPTIPSRFIQLLTTIADINEAGEYKFWAEEMVRPEEIKACEQPKPVPPLADRPRKLSVTRIGKLMRDPYVIYADKVLRLKKIDEIDQDIGAADFGNFVHEAIEECAKGEMSFERLLECGEKVIKRYGDRVGVRAFWWPRFEKIAGWIVQQETSAEILSEEEESFKFITTGGEFELTAKADRIEISDNIKIVDYKTGAVPSRNDVVLGLEPQLPLEGVIFSEKYNKEISAFEFWELKGSENGGQIKIVKCDPAEIIEEAKHGVKNLIEKFDDPKTAYIAKPRPAVALKYNDYEHLARNKEWDS